MTPLSGLSAATPEAQPELYSRAASRALSPMSVVSDIHPPGMSNIFPPLPTHGVNRQAAADVSAMDVDMDVSRMADAGGVEWTEVRYGKRKSASPPAGRDGSTIPKARKSSASEPVQPAHDAFTIMERRGETMSSK